MVRQEVVLHVVRSLADFALKWIHLIFLHQFTSLTAYNFFIPLDPRKISSVWRFCFAKIWTEATCPGRGEGRDNLTDDHFLIVILYILEFPLHQVSHRSSLLLLCWSSISTLSVVTCYLLPYGVPCCKWPLWIYLEVQNKFCKRIPQYCVAIHTPLKTCLYSSFLMLHYLFPLLFVSPLHCHSRLAWDGIFA